MPTNTNTILNRLNAAWNPGYGRFKIIRVLIYITAAIATRYLLEHYIHNPYSLPFVLALFYGMIDLCLYAFIFLLIILPAYMTYTREGALATKILEDKQLPCTRCGYTLLDDETHPCPECGKMLSREETLRYWKETLKYWKGITPTN